MAKKNIGVLLCNLGTPASSQTRDVRRFLAEFLSDPRVIEIPMLLWWPILHGIILRTRPRQSAKLYKKIWSVEGSPLLVISQKQQRSLQDLFQNNNNGDVSIALGMRYGKPSIAAGLAQLQSVNVEKIIVLSLYPQYSSSATGSNFDAVMKALQKWRFVPEIDFISDYSSHPLYINAVANSIENFWVQHSRGEKLLFSFHGLPKNSITKNDPYYFACQNTAALVAEKLQLNSRQWRVTFQSRFGAQAWLQPYSDKTLQELPKQGIKKIDIICPGFAADCLETLEEMNIRNREVFLEAGGEQFQYIPALNNSPHHIEALAAIIEERLNANKNIAQISFKPLASIP